MATPETAKHPAPRVSILSLLSRLLLAITCLLGGVLTVAGISAYQARHAVLERSLHVAEEIASQIAGVPVTVGRVGGPYWSGLDLYDVRVYGSRKAGAPIIASAPRIHASYNLLEILKLGKKPINVEVYGPRLTLDRDAKGRLNYLPVFPKGTGEPSQFPSLPRIHVRVHDGSAGWHDRAMPGVADFRSLIADVTGTVDLVNQVLYFHEGGHEGGAGVTVDGSVNLERLSGRVHGLATGVPTARWINYLAFNPQYTITGGSARVETEVSWARPDGAAVRIRGGVRVRDGSLVAKDVLRPIRDVVAIATFDNHTVTIPDIHGTLSGNHWGGSGQVFGLDKPRQRLAFRGAAPSVDIASLMPLVPQLAVYKLSGQGSATGVVTGTTLYPIVDARALVSAGHVLDQTVTNLTGAVHYEGNRVQVSGWQGTLNGGQVAGDSSFTLEPMPKLTTQAHWEGVDLPATLRPYLKQPIGVTGRLKGEVTVGGNVLAPVASGTVLVDEPWIARQPLSMAQAQFAYDHHRLKLAQGAVDVGRGQLRFSGAATDAGDFTGQVALERFDLADLSRLGLEAPVTGTASGSGVVAGNWWHPADVTAQGGVAVAQATLQDQEVPEASAAWAIARSRLSLTQVALTTGGGSVTGQLGLELAALPRNGTGLRADFTVDRVDLSRVAPLVAWAQPEIGTLKGLVSATGSVESDGAGYRLQAEAVAQELDAERLGHLKRLSGPIYFGRQRLTFPQLVLELGKQSNATLQGSVAFDGPAPTADLELALRDAPAKEVLTAMNWQQLLGGTWWGRRLAPKPVEGPREVIATLDGPTDLVSSGSVHLKPLLDHWNRHHLEPLAAAQAYLGANRPFWQAIDGRVSLDLAYQGVATDPEVRVRLALKDGVAYDHRLRNAHVTAVYRDRHLHVPVLDVIEADANGAAIQARGVLGTDGVLAVYGQNIDLAWLNPYLVGQELSLGGHGAFTLLAKGDPTDPRLEISAEARDGQVGPTGAGPSAAENRFGFSQATARATYYRGRVSIDRGRVETDGKEALISGSFPVISGLDNDTMDVALDLQGESLGIVSAITRGEVLWKGGPGHASLKLGGTLESPELSGVIQLDGVTLRDRNLKQDIKNLRALATITTNAVLVQRATAEYGGGSVVLTGQLALKRFQPDAMRLQLITRHTNVGLTSGLFQGLVDSSIELNGTVGHPAVSGNAMVSGGKVDLAVLDVGSNAPAAAPILPVDLRDLTLVLNPRDRVTVLGPKEPIAGVVDGRYMDVSVDGNLLVNGTLESPQVKGTVFVRSGTFTPLNNPFDIVSGTIEFLGAGINQATDTAGFEDVLPQTSVSETGPKLPEARLNVVAKGQVYDYNSADFPLDSKYKNGGLLNLRLTVTGSLQSMERKFECVDFPNLTQDRIEKVLGKESLITYVFNSNSNPSGSKSENKGVDIVSNEVSGFLSTTSRRFFNPVTSRMQDFLQLEALGFDFVSSIDQQQQSYISGLGLSPSFYTETRPLFGGIALSARYTFLKDRSAFDAGLNYRINEYLALQAGVDNRQITSQTPATFRFWGDINPSITLTTQRHF